MAFSIKKQIAALAVSALALAPVATGVTLLTAEPAFAKPKENSGGGRESSRRDRGDRDSGNRGASRSNNSNRSSGNDQSGNDNSNSRSTQTRTTTTQQVAAASNGNAYGQRTADEERPGQGAIRSELKGMNAIHSFKDGAFPDAAPESQVGRLAAYLETAGVTPAAFEDYESAKGLVDDFNAANDGFIADLEGSETALADALTAFDANYAPDGLSLEIDSLADVYVFLDAAYGTPDEGDDPIDTPEELQSLIEVLTQEQTNAPVDAPIDNSQQIASLETLKLELETLEGLNEELALQEEYVALSETLTVEQCDYQNALDGEGDAFLEASNGREFGEFSDATITYLRDALGLGETYAYPENPAADCPSS